MAYIGQRPANLGQQTSEDTFTATAGQTVFTLTADVGRKSDIIISINGVVQAGTAYGVSGTGGRTLTFTSGVTLNNIVRILHIGYKPATITVANSGVTTAKIADNAVTGAKIAMGSDAAGDILYYNGTDYIRLAKGTASQHLAINSGATAPEWVTAVGGGPSLGTLSVIRTNAKTISENITFAGTENGMSAGPITIADSYTVTVANGSTWTIV